MKDKRKEKHDKGNKQETERTQTKYKKNTDSNKNIKTKNHARTRARWCKVNDGEIKSVIFNALPKARSGALRGAMAGKNRFKQKNIK